jgi:uncharacterized protein
VLTLRGHHLLCSLNYSGKGYSPEFITNFDDWCARVTRGEAVRLTWAPDTICQPVVGTAGYHCHNMNIPVRDFLGFLATSWALKKWMFPPRIVQLTAADVGRLRAAFRTGKTRAACLGCQWFSTCSATAAGGNTASKLHQPKR